MSHTSFKHPLHLEGHFFPLRYIPSGWESETGTVHAVLVGISQPDESLRGTLARVCLAQTREHAGVARLAHYRHMSGPPQQGLAVTLPSRFDHERALLVGSSSNPTREPYIGIDCQEPRIDPESPIDTRETLTRISESLVTALKTILSIRYEIPYVHADRPIPFTVNELGQWEEVSN